MPETLRIPYPQVLQTLTQILQSAGMRPDRANKNAELFANASRDGIPSHGLNRFANFAKRIRDNSIHPNADPTLTQSFGVLERWNGNGAPGPSNAWLSMQRAIDIARTSGIGCVALAHTNHWMRAGNYGWQAADNNCIGICWTNTWPLMAPWGAKTKKVGNNPLVIAVPRASGNHVVLDMAMSQYSMGKLAIFQAAGTPSPTPAGFDAHGNITSDPAAVINGGSGMPIGLWKGTGLALMLDLVASILSAGLSTADLAHEKWEHKVSQLFLAIDTRQLHAPEIADRIIAAYQHGNESTLYPGERVLRFRHESERSGVPIDAAVWNEITAL